MNFLHEIPKTKPLILLDCWHFKITFMSRLYFIFSPSRAWKKAVLRLLLRCARLCPCYTSMRPRSIAKTLLKLLHMSLVMRKPDFRICENKGADQLCGNRTADQRLCLRYTDSTIPLLSKCEISSLEPSSVTAQPGLCQTWSETPKTSFLTTRLISRSTTTGK